MFAPEDNGGDNVVQFQLEKDQGVENSDFTVCADIQSDLTSTLERTLTVADDGIEFGKVYSFRFRSKNRVGWSSYTELLRIGIVDQVPAPTNLGSDLEKATATSLEVHWDMVGD
jgi:hypothetical protein